MTDPRFITATIDRPQDPYGSDWNWALAAETAWRDVATRHGLAIQDETDYGFDYNTVAARLKIDGQWYDLEVGSDADHPNEVRAELVDTLTLTIPEQQAQDRDQWYTPGVVTDDDGDEIDSVPGPVSEDRLPDQWDNALVKAGFQRVGNWVFTDGHPSTAVVKV